MRHVTGALPKMDQLRFLSPNRTATDHFTHPTGILSNGLVSIQSSLEFAMSVSTPPEFTRVRWAVRVTDSECPMAFVSTAQHSIKPA
jgi:hypothetical protein